MGKVVSAFHYERLCSMLEDHGGEVIVGNPNAHKDMLLKPTVVLNPDLNSKMMKEEIFGLILPVFVFDEIDTAIDFINKEEKPLTIYF